MQAIHAHKITRETRKPIYNLFAAYIHTVPLAELLESLERSRRDAQLRHVGIYGAACSYCLARAERLNGSYLRTFALELKEQLVQTLAASVTSILAGPHRLDAEEAAEPRLRNKTNGIYMTGEMRGNRIPPSDSRATGFRPLETRRILWS